MTDSSRGKPVLWDSFCGEPIGWLKFGAPVIAQEWSPDGPIVMTDVLSPWEAAELYGPVTNITTGPQGGWRSITYGEKTFLSRRLSPSASNPREQLVRPPATPEEAAWPAVRCQHGEQASESPRCCTKVEDPDLSWPCPQCGAEPGRKCEGATKHRARRAETLYEMARTTELALRRELERIPDLEKQLDGYRHDCDHMRRELGKNTPRCGRPTRSGTPCNAEARFFPPIADGGSCKAHLTREEVEAIEEAQRAQDERWRETRLGPRLGSDMVRLIRELHAMLPISDETDA